VKIILFVSCIILVCDGAFADSTQVVELRTTDLTGEPENENWQVVPPRNFASVKTEDFNSTDVLLAQKKSRRRERGSSRNARNNAGKSPFSHRFNFHLDGGYDDNPFKLARNIRTGLFAQAQARYDLTYRQSKTLDLFGKARFRATQYEDDVGDANREDGRLTIGMTNRSLQMGSGRVRLSLGAAYGFRNLTFVDKVTGIEAVSGGESIGDRFDTDWYEIFGHVSAPVTESTTLLLKLVGHFEDYQNDFTELGLDRLDYTQVTLEPGIRQKLGKNLTLQVLVPVSERIFDDRRADDLNGNDIAGTNLRYRFFGAKVLATERFSKGFNIRLGAGVEWRTDNESGFDNSTKINVSARAAYTTLGGDKLSANFTWLQREFDNINFGAINENNDGGRKSRGYRFSLTYVRPKVMLGADLQLHLQREAFTNSDLNFEYERYTARGGLRVRF